jgi:hypothetical protein
MLVSMNVKALKYAAASLTAVTGILHLYAIGYYDLMAYTFAQGGGIAYVIFFGAVGIGLLVASLLIAKGVRWASYAVIIYLPVGFGLYLLGAYGSVIPGTPFGTEILGETDKTIQVILWILLILSVRKSSQ